MPAYISGLTPLTDLLTGTYNGYEGGLYEGVNSVPAGHNTEGLTAGAAVVKRNAAGTPAANGKIGLLCLGMSNGRLVAAELIPLMTSKQDAVVPVNGCQTARDIVYMVDNEAAYYAEVDDRLDSKGLTPEQVGVVWLYTAEAGPSGSFPTHANTLKGYFKTVIEQIAARYINCKQIYLISREYGGYSASGNPENYAYETSFAIKWLVLDQVYHATTGDPDLAYGTVPWLGWTTNTYTWANGLGSDLAVGGTPGRSDGLEYLSTDFSDGLHPTVVGATKIANLILPEFESGPYAAPWWYAEIEPALLDDTASNSAADDFDSGSFTPSPETLILIFFKSRAGVAAAPLAPTATGHSITWALEERRVYGTEAAPRAQVGVIRGVSGASPTAGTVNLDFGQTQTVCDIAIVEIVGAYTGGTAGALGIVQSVGNSADDVPTGTPLQITLAAETTEAIILAVFGNTVGASFDEKSGWVELLEVEPAGSPLGLMQVQWLAGYDSPAEATRAGAGAMNIGGVAIGVRLPPPKYLLEVSVTGSGTVTSDPAGIDCTSECDYEFYEDTEVTLTAVAAFGYRFDGWTGDCDSEAGPVCTVTIDEAKSITAAFSRIQTYAGNPQGLQLALLDAPGGRLLADFSPVASGVTVTDGPHGFESLAAELELPLRPSARWYRESRALYVRLAWGAAIAWEGRLEDKALRGDGLRLGCFGYWRAFMDMPYTALWSQSGTAGWQPVNSDNNGSYVPEAFEGDNNNRIYIAPREDETYDFFHQGGWTLETPHNSERVIVAIDFDYHFDAPVDWRALLIEGDWDDYTLDETIHWQVDSAGTAQVGTISIVLSPGANRLIFALYYNDVLTPAVYTGVTGACFLKITNVRIATTTRDRINTTLGTTIAAGTRTVTPASMANIYVGQLLRINQGSASNAETVVVTAVTSTTLTAVFQFAHNLADNVEAIVVYADEIAESLVDFVDATNPGQLNTNTAAIEAHGRDLLNESYLDTYPADILTYLAGIGDVDNERWEVGVREDRRLFFRPKGTNGRTWYVDATGLELERSLDDIANSVYAIHQNSAGGQAGTRRTTATENQLSIERHGLTRRAAVISSTSSLTQAGDEAQAAVDYRSNPPPRLALSFDALFTAGGARVRQKWQVRAGDTIVLRNVDPTLLSSNDQILSFRVGRATYSADGDRITVEPESPAPSLVQMLAESNFVPQIYPFTHGDFPGPVIDPGHGGWGGWPGPIIIGGGH